MFYSPYPAVNPYYPQQINQNTYMPYMPQPGMQPQMVEQYYPQYQYVQPNIPNQNDLYLKQNYYGPNMNMMNSMPPQNYNYMNTMQPQMPPYGYQQQPMQKQQSQQMYYPMKILPDRVNAIQEQKTQILNQTEQQLADSQQSEQKRKRKKVGKPYQDTKNIPKNYTKAILRYIRQNEVLVERLMDKRFSYKQFIRRIEIRKDKVISIRVFKSLFYSENGDEETKEYCRVFRILAYKFLREDFVQYIFNNKKIKQAAPMIKYLNVVLQGLKDPKGFTSWKIDHKLDFAESTYVDSALSTMDE